MVEPRENVVFFVVDERYFPLAYVNGARIAQLAENGIAVEVFVESAGVPDFPPVDGVRVRHNRLSPHLPDNLPFNERFPSVVWGRIAAPAVLQDAGYKRALYLDADIGIAGDILSVFSLDMAGLCLAAVPDTGMELPHSHIDPRRSTRSYLDGIGFRGSRYFNSGVLLLDIDSWVKMDVLSRLPDYSAQYGGRSVLLDQDFLNVVFQDIWQVLSPRWNFQGMHMDLELERVFRPLIVHYTTPVRPWLEDGFIGDPVHPRYFARLLDRMGFDRSECRQPGPGVGKRRSAPGAFKEQYRTWLFERGILTPKVRHLIKKWRAARKCTYDSVLKYLVDGMFCDISPGEAAPMIEQINRLIARNDSDSFLPTRMTNYYFIAGKEHWPGFEVD